MKRVISAMLLSALAVTSASCGSSGVPDDTKSQDVTNAPNETTTAAETELLPDIPAPEDTDYSGYEFRVLYQITGWGTYTNEHIDSEAQTGDVLADALYNRNRLCEEKYGFKLVEVAKNEYVTNPLKSSIMAGDDDYDLAMITYGWAQGTDMLIDFNSVPHIDTNKPWWNTNAAQQMEVNGALTNALSDFIITHRDGTVATFFNKKLADEYKVENLYDLVRSGKWTLDKFSEYAKQVSADIDSDGEYTEKDRFGYSAIDNNSFIYMYFGSGMKLVEIEDDQPAVAIGSERAIDVYQKIIGILTSDNIHYSPNHVKNTGTDGDQSIFRVFNEGRALFLSHGIGSANRFRKMKEDFGVLPAPKFDEEQENYCNIIDAGKYMVIPKTATDLDRTGVILESLSYEGYRSVISAYYDTMLKNKLMRDEDSIEMLDEYIFPNSVVKGFFYEPAQVVLQNIINSPDAIASTIASNMSSMQEKINDIYATFTE